MKQCKRCGQQKPITEFKRIKIAKSCFRFWCEKCCDHYDKWQHKKLVKCLRIRFHSMVRRCTDGSDANYEYYGGRGIKCLFKSANDYIDYIINDLKGDTFVKIKELDVDRIDNNGHYEPGNIRLVSHQENCNNREKRI